MFASCIFTTMRRTALGLLISAGTLGTAQAAFVNLTASQTTVQLGGTFSLYFAISGLGSASLATFDLDLGFNPAVLAFTGASFDDDATAQNQLALAEAGSQPFFGGAAMIGSVVDAYFVSGNSAAKLNADQADSFRFLTLNFTALALSAGSELAIDFSDSFLSFNDAENNRLNFTFGNSSAIVAVTTGPGGGTVPEPGALGLATLALAGAALARGTRRRTAAVTTAIPAA